MLNKLRDSPLPFRPYPVRWAASKCSSGASQAGRQLREGSHVVQRKGRAMIIETPKHIEPSLPIGGKVGGVPGNTGTLRRWRSLKLTILAVVALITLLAVVSGL